MFADVTFKYLKGLAYIVLEFFLMLSIPCVAILTRKIDISLVHYSLLSNINYGR